jgi:hypothetical protein
VGGHCLAAKTGDFYIPLPHLLDQQLTMMWRQVRSAELDYSYRLVSQKLICCSSHVIFLSFCDMNPLYFFYYLEKLMNKKSNIYRRQKEKFTVSRYEVIGALLNFPV